MRYLVRDERVMLGYWLAKEKISLRTIAHRLNRAYSTITDEVRKVGGDYLAEIAQKMTRENLKRRGRKTTNEQHLGLLDFIERHYDPKDASLKQLLQRWKRFHPNAPTLATIYNWIAKGIIGIKPEQLLRTRQQRQTTIKTWKRMAGTPISLRKHDFPALMGEYGHWEGDLIVGAQNNKGYILSLVERKSRFGITKRLTSKNSQLVLNTLHQILKKNAALPFKSITFDNGWEFSQAHQLEKMGVKIYHAFPYSSWQRGRNENWNGILRRWFPKSTNFLKVADQALAAATDRINNMEREILQWKSAREALETRSLV